MRSTFSSLRRLSIIAACAAGLIFFSFSADTFSMGGKPQSTSANATQQAPPVQNATAPIVRHGTVKATAHYGTLGSGQGLFRFIFNQQMIDPEKTTPDQLIAPEKFPVIFTPALPGEGKWVSPTELHFTSYDKIPRGTAYGMESREGVVSLAGDLFKQKFKPYAPYPFTWGSVYQQRFSPEGAATLLLTFSTRVDLGKLKHGLDIKDNTGQSLAFEIHADTGNSSYLPGTRFLVTIKPKELGTLTLSLPGNFAGEDGPMGLSLESTALVERPVEVTSMLSIRSVRARQTNSPPWDRYIEVTTSNDADSDTLRKYIDITPATDINIQMSRDGGFYIFGDFLTRPRVSVTFKKGMPGLYGVLADDYKATIVFPDFSPRLALDTQGSILSPKRAMRVPLSTINVERVQATLWQLPESNIPLMAMGFFDNYRKHLSRKLAVRSGAVNGMRNHAAETSIDLTQLAGNAKGVFLLTVMDASDAKKVIEDEPQNNDDYYYYDDLPQIAEKLVVVSDIGITARVMPKSVTVWANSIASAEAIKNAQVRVFTANNILLAEGKTDNDGLWTLTRTEAWDKNRERPALVVVSTAAPVPPGRAGDAETSPLAQTKDIAFVKLDSDLTLDEAFDSSGRAYLTEGYEAFCFTPRGIFRPGETVDFKVLVRDSHMKAPAPFPVAWKVSSSTGRTVGQGTSLLSAQGGASFNLPLVTSAPTGRYTMTVSIPGQPKNVLGATGFSVEEFAPPRLEVTLTPSAPFFMQDQTVNIDINAAYLFGTPVAGAPWESSVRAQPGYFSHPSWPAFTFPNNSDEKLATEDMEQNGVLNEKGQASFTLASPSDSQIALNLSVTVRVREDGGRWVGRNITIPYYSNPVLLGYELPRQEATAGSPYAVRVAAVTPEGKPAAVGKARAVVEMISRYYVRSDRGYTRSFKYSTVAEAEVPLEAGQGSFTFTPPRRGDYRIRLEAPETKAQTSTYLSVWSGLEGSEDGGSPLIDRVMLSWDKPSYVVGDTAILTVRAPFTGKLLLVLEAEKEIYRQPITLKGPETTVRVPVLSAMAPNAYASAWVIRPVKEGEAWGAHRAYGIVPLKLDHSAAQLSVEIDAPKSTLPKGEMPVTITLKNAAGQPVQGEVTLAFVDEGLLSLTNFTTPNPLAFFTAKRALLSSVFDLYDNLMPLSTRKAISLIAGGDSGDDGSLLSPMTRRLELLSIFMGSIATNAQGVAQATLNLPEYSGKGRLMAVAASSAGLGHAQAAVQVARAVTIEATVPRMLAPGDSFTAPIFVFGSDATARKAVVRVEAEGPLSITGSSEFAVSLDAQTPKVALSLAVTAAKAAGMGVLHIRTSIEGSTEPPFEQRLEIPVRPPFPRITVSGGGTVREGTPSTLDFTKDFFPGTQNVVLSFAGTPGVTVVKAMEYLRGYPYWCLEQTISRAWPFLAVPALLKAVDPEVADNSEFKDGLNYAIRRILAMQRPDGGFNMWPGSASGNGEAYAWGSVYAAHFLTEAKASGLVPDDALKAALAWMRSYLAGQLPENSEYAVIDALSTKAYIAYVLTLNGDAPLGWMQFLQEQGKFLSPSAQIFLSGAYALATGKSSHLHEAGILPIAASPHLGWSLESAARNEALRLLMWASVDPFAQQTATLAARVIEDGNNDRWFSTQENAMAVMALGRFAEKNAATGKEFSASLSARNSEGKDTTLATFTHGETPVFRGGRSGELLPLATPVTVSLSGDGTAYFSWKSTGVPTTPQPASSEGMYIGRRWTLPDGTVIDFMENDKEGTPHAAARSLKIPQGTKVTVTVFVKPTAGFNSLILADIVPAGFEIDNPNLIPDSGGTNQIGGALVDPKTGKRVPAPAFFTNPLSLNEYMETRVEMRDDRLLLFVNEMPARASSFSYTLRAVTKGSFVLPPLAAEAMYDPSIKAVTVPGTVTVE